MTDYLTEVLDRAQNRNNERANLNFKRIQAQLDKHRVTLAAVEPIITSNTVPTNPTAVFGTNGGKVVDNVLLDTVTVQYTAPSPLGSFAGVFLVAKNYNGSATLVKVAEDTFHGAAGTTQTFVTILQRTNEAVTFYVVPKTATELTPDDWTTASSFVLTLNGLVSAPPPPTIVQTLVATPTGYQFSFNQVVAAGTVIDSYKVYRNTSFTTSGATVIRTYKHDQTNSGSNIVVQDVSPDGVPYCYWVSTVNSSGMESTLAAAESGVIFATIPLTMNGQPVVAAPLVPTNHVLNGGALAQWTAGLNVTLPGSIDFDVLAASVAGGVILDVLLYSSTGGIGPNGYLLRFDSRTSHPAGQILKVTNGTWANIGTQIAANNASVLTGWHSVMVRITGQGQFDIFVDNVWQTTVIDTTFALTGATYYGWEVAGGSTLAPPAFIQKTQDHLPDGGVYTRTSYIAGDVLVENGNFEASTSLIPPPGYAYFSTPALVEYDTSTPYSGSQSIKITTSGASGGIVPIRKVMCRPGDVFFASARVKFVSGPGSARVAISFRDANGTGVGGADATSTNSSWTLVTNIATAPAGTVFATFELYTDGTSTVVEFDEHYVRCARNLDNEVTDGSTYNKVKAGAVTSGNIDPSKSGVLAKGSIPPTSNSSFVYTSTTTSILWQWYANQAIFRADGTATLVGSGTQNVTGLTANNSYYFYPYYDETLATLKWLQASDVTIPNITGVTLNGSTQFIQTTTASTHADPGASIQYSLEFWIKTTTTTNEGILSFSAPQGSGTVTAQQVQVSIGGALGEINFAYANSSAAVKSLGTTGASANDGAWHHVVITFATGGNITIYVDGTSRGTASAQGAQGTAGANCWWHIGMAHGSASWPVSTTTFLNGTVSHVAVYPAALSASQVASHCQSFINLGSAIYDTTVANDTATYYWKLTETSGTNAADSAGTNTGTYQNTPTLNQTSPIISVFGTPQIAWPFTSFLATQAQNLQGRIPLSGGSVIAATPLTGGGGGTGGGATGGGSRGGCFSGNTRIKTWRGMVPIKDIVTGDMVLTAGDNWRKVLQLIEHTCNEADVYGKDEPGTSPIVQRRSASGAWLMLDMGDDELITLNHAIRLGQEWPRAYEIFNGKKVLEYHQPVYNLAVDADTSDDGTAPDTDHSYTLGNGLKAHNALNSTK